MNEPAADDRALAQLRPPCRNRYFDGRILTARDLEREQAYGRGADAQLARLVLGGGVVCGLAVTAASEGGQQGVRVGAGLALDPWGRRIVVPDDVELIPLVPVDRGEEPSSPGARSQLTVWLRQQTREAEIVPRPVPDERPDPVEQSEAGAWVEGYCLEVRAGAPPAAPRGCSEAALELMREGRLDEALHHLAAATCAAPPTDPSVVLAGISVGEGGELTVQAGQRVVVPTNVLLLELIASLASFVEASFGGRAPAR
jgi:hypothetical protein